MENRILDGVNILTIVLGIIGIAVNVTDSIFDVGTGFELIDFFGCLLAYLGMVLAGFQLMERHKHG